MKTIRERQEIVLQEIHDLKVGVMRELVEVMDGLLEIHEARSRYYPAKAIERCAEIAEGTALEASGVGGQLVGHSIAKKIRALQDNPE